MKTNNTLSKSLLLLEMPYLCDWKIPFFSARAITKRKNNGNYEKFEVRWEVIDDEVEKYSDMFNFRDYKVYNGAGQIVDAVLVNLEFLSRMIKKGFYDKNLREDKIINVH